MNTLSETILDGALSKDNSICVKKSIVIDCLNYYVGEHRILKDVKLHFHTNAVTTIIGPSGGGKTSLLRTINRMNEKVPDSKITGTITYRGNDINHYNEYLLRTKIGMVFQKPAVFSQSIYENVVFGLRRKNKKLKKPYLDEIVEEKLLLVNLWSEVKDRLGSNAADLSVGQQQRLCIARTLALEPDVILMDEPTSALDPVSTDAIYNLINTLKLTTTIIFVTHNVRLAKKIGDYVVFVCDGVICEQGECHTVFNNPCHTQTISYLNCV